MCNIESHQRYKSALPKLESDSFSVMCQIYIVSGLAGSGKTDLTARFKEAATANGKRVYVVNLDPAAAATPYAVNLDIRDTVKYHRLMEDRKMGPNGAILLALNMFSTKVHQLHKLLRSKCATYDYIIVDTPGQIEMFTWSAAGDIFCKMLTKISMEESNVKFSLLYLMDNEKRCRRGQSQAFLASNLLLACSIKYRMRIPMELVFTKCDRASPELVLETTKEPSLYSESLHQDVMDTFSPLFSTFPQHYVAKGKPETLLTLFV